MLDQTINVSMLTSTAVAKKQNKFQVSSGLREDPKSNAHIFFWGGEEVMRETLDFSTLIK